MGFSSVKDIDLIQCYLKSVSIYSHQTCEILRARDCDLYPTIYLISLSENYSKTIKGKLAGYLLVKDVDLIQPNLKSVSIFSYY